MGGDLKNRVRITNTVRPENAENLKKLSEITRINMSLLVDEALEDLFIKHELDKKIKVQQ